MIFESKPSQLGHSAEVAACHYLKQQGLSFVQSNFRCKAGEIDIIMQEGEILVFIEVRMRNFQINNNQILESITYKKQCRIMRTALFYLKNKKLPYKVPFRFDIIAVRKNEDKYNFQWIKGAFDISLCGY